MEIESSQEFSDSVQSCMFIANFAVLSSFALCSYLLLSKVIDAHSFILGALAQLLVLVNVPIVYGIARKLVGNSFSRKGVLSKRRGEIYGIGHQLLNLNSHSMWLNFGYWNSQLIEELSQILHSQDAAKLVTELFI